MSSFLHGQNVDKGQVSLGGALAKAPLILGFDFRRLMNKAGQYGLGVAGGGEQVQNGTRKPSMGEGGK